MQAHSFSWLHLSDLHFGLDGQGHLWPNLREPFFADLVELHRQTGPWQAVLFTGDLVQAGKSAEFQQLQKDFIVRLWEKLSELGSGDAVLLAVPGNHDLYRPNPREDNPAVDGLLDVGDFHKIAAKFWNNPTGAYRRVVNDAFVAYSEWWRSAPQRPKDVREGILPGDFACTLGSDGLSIGIVGLNTAFLQLGGGDYQGKLVWDSRQLHAVCGGAVDDWQRRHDVCLLLTHQGPEWLTPEARVRGETEIAPAGRFGAHLFGHMHETKVQYVQIGGNPDGVLLCQGSSVFGMEKIGEPPSLLRTHGYAVGRIEFGIASDGQASLRLWPRVATKKTGPWRFIPDYENAFLRDDDNGTTPRTISSRPRRGLDAANTDAAVPNHPTGQGQAVSASVAPRRDSAPGPRTTLPTRRPFFGRTKELAEIERFLQDGFKGWGVVLDGPGGMGKTALALEAAHRAPVERFPLKVFVSAKSTRLDPDGERAVRDMRVDDFFGLLTELGLALGREDVQKTPAEQKVALVRHALAGQRALLVLDNLETFTRLERRRVYDLLELLPAGCRAIVTSRRRDETAARTLRLDKLDFDAAKELLAEMGARIPAVAKLGEEDRQTLYIETGGNPLLLTWVAAQLGRTQGRCRTVAEAVLRLHEAHRQQQVNERNDPLEFVFGDLLDTFTSAETEVLAALAHFPEPARLAWLVPVAGLSETAAQTALDDLRDRALLLEDEAEGTWLLPPLCRHFLRLRRAEAVGAAGQRLAQEASALALRHGGDDSYPYSTLETVWPSVQAALPLLLAGDNARLQTVCDALDRFLGFSGRWDVRLWLSQEAEAKAVAAGDDDNAGWRAVQAGFVHVLQGEADAVLACAERCASHWQRAEAGSRQRAYPIRLRGHGHRLRKDWGGASTAFQQALELFQALAPESADVVGGLMDLANVKQDSGDWDGAEADWREALRLARKLDHREAVAIISGNLAGLHLVRKDWPAAEREAVEALALASTVGRVELVAANHRRLAQARQAQRRADAALPHARQAVAIYTRLRSRNLAEAEATLAACEAALTDPFPNLQAEVNRLEILFAQNPAKHGPSFANSLRHLSDHLAQERNDAEAVHTVQREVEVWESLNEQDPNAYAPGLAGGLHRLSDFAPDLAAAVTLLGRAIATISPHVGGSTQHQDQLDAMQASLRQKIAGLSKAIGLRQLQLRNFRGFANLDVDFAPGLTVLVAENGRGKTAILDACRIALWPFVSSFDLAHSQNDWQSGICIDDVHLQKMPAGDFVRQLPASVTASGPVGVSPQSTWTLLRDSDQQESTTKDGDGTDWIKTWARLLQAQIRLPKQAVLDLPVFAYYGTGRLWSQRQLGSTEAEPKQSGSENDIYIRTYAYRDCLDSTSSYHRFVDWFRWISEAHNESKVKNADQGLPPDTPSPWLDKIQMVQQAIDCLLKDTTGWHSLEYSVSHERSLVLRNGQNETMKVSQLSDGIRNMLAMLGDLAHRCIRLNPHLGRRAVADTAGVVLIDEIDMHLHPGWQQRVADQLQAAFPKIQFIVTTHSPQVLSSVLARRIRVLRPGAGSDSGSAFVKPIEKETRGVASSDVLALIMGIHPVPDVPEAQKLERYRALIQQGLHESEEGVRLKEELLAHFGPEHDAMLECASMLELEAFKRKVAQKRAEAAKAAQEADHA